MFILSNEQTNEILQQLQKDVEYEQKEKLLNDDLDCDIFESNIQENLEDGFVQEALNKVNFTAQLRLKLNLLIL